MIQTKEAFKEALNHGLVLNKVNKVINFNQEAWSKAYIYINTDLRSNEKKNDLKKVFFKLINNSVFRKTIYNAKKI